MTTELFLLAYLTYILTVVAVKLQASRRDVLACITIRHLQIGFSLTALTYVYQLFFAEEVIGVYMSVTSFGTSLKLLTLFCAMFILSASKRYMNEHARHLLEYPLVFSLATLFLLLLIGSTHMMATFFALVGFSLNLYVLVLFDAPYAAAREAGIKYYYLSTFSSGLILYGIFLLFVVTGTLQFDEIAQELTAPSPMLRVGITFLLIGFFFKLSAFPGHLWAPEVYEGSPDPVMGFFMLPVKIAVLGAVMQMLTIALKPALAVWQPILTFAVIGSLLWGCFGALYEKKVKRFLAYASINQMGFLLMGIACGTLEGYRATTLYLFLYALMSVGFLVIFFNARRTSDGRPLKYLTDFRGLVSWPLAMILLSMAGIPPLAGFFGKYYLLLHAFEQGFYLMVITGLVTSLVSTYYYLRIIKTMWFETELPNSICTLSHPQMALLRGTEVGLWGLLLVLSPILTHLTLPALHRVRPLFAIAPIIPTTSYGMIVFLAAIGVVLLPNPVHNLLCLITAFLAMVALFLSVQVEFLAFIFLIVYVGAVAILFLFVIMLLNVKELTMNAPKGRAGAFLVIFPLFLKLLHTLSLEFKEITVEPSSTFEQLLYYVEAQYQDIAIFTALYTEHATLFVLITLILLTAMIGAIVLASSSLDTQKLAVPPLLIEGLSPFLQVGLLLAFFAFVLRNRPKAYPQGLFFLAVMLILASFFEKEICDFILSFLDFQYQLEHIFLPDAFLVLLGAGALFNEVAKGSSSAKEEKKAAPQEKMVTMTAAQKEADLNWWKEEGKANQLALHRGLFFVMISVPLALALYCLLNQPPTFKLCYKNLTYSGFRVANLFFKSLVAKKVEPFLHRKVVFYGYSANEEQSSF